MTITYDSTQGVLIVTGQEIVDYVNDADSYTGISITANKDCGSPNTQTSATEDFFSLVANTLYINPEMFGIGAYLDGIYKLDIKFVKVSGYVLISNCLFVDITLRCRVASLLQNIVEENKIEDNEKVSTIVHLLHYALVNGSNCGCNCIEMCGVFLELNKLLLNIDPQITNNCGSC